MESLQEYFERNDAESQYQRWRRGAFQPLTPAEETDTIDMIMGRGNEIPRPIIRFYDAGVDGSNPPPEFIESRFYTNPIFFTKNLPLVGFWCDIDNPYFGIESHYFDLMVVYKQDLQELLLPFQRTIDINQSSFGWTHSGRPRDGWISAEWDVFAFADAQLVASGSFMVI